MKHSIWKSTSHTWSTLNSLIKTKNWHLGFGHVQVHVPIKRWSCPLTWKITEAIDIQSQVTYYGYPSISLYPWIPNDTGITRPTARFTRSTCRSWSATSGCKSMYFVARLSGATYVQSAGCVLNNLAIRTEWSKFTIVSQPKYDLVELHHK